MARGRPAVEERIFEELKRILYRWAPALDVADNAPGRYYLNTRHVMKNKKPLFFGSAEIRKTYVSFHLMPVYVNPGLLDGMSPALRKRMQGKSCFNFKQPDASLIAELRELTRAGYEDYVEQGYIDG